MDARARGVLLVLCGAIFLEGIDVAMLNVALPSIRADLGLSTGTLSGVVSAFVVGYGGFLLLGGRVADVFGRRRTFLASLAVFIVFSGLGGFATEGWMLLVARFVTGMAAAFMTPAGLSLVTTTFAEGPQRDKAVLVYAGTAAGGFSFGLVVGGLLASVNWRWVFFAPVIMAAVVLVAAIVLVREAEASRPAVTSRLPRRDRLGGSCGLAGFDVAGAVTVTGAALLLVYAVVRLEHPGRDWVLTAAAAVAGSGLLAVFVAVERRAAAPLVRLGILRSAPLVRANLGAMTLTGSFFGFQFLVTLYLQELRGWSAIETSLALLVVAIDAVLAPTLTPRLVRRFGNVPVIFGGLALAVVAYLLFLPVGLDWTYAAMFPTMIILGLGFALAYGPLTIAATECISDDEQGLASGLLNASFQFGAAFGISAATAVYAASSHGGLSHDGQSPQEALDAFRAAFAVPVVAGCLGLVVTAFSLFRRTEQQHLHPVEGLGDRVGVQGLPGPPKDSDTNSETVKKVKTVKTVNRSCAGSDGLGRAS